MEIDIGLVPKNGLPKIGKVYINEENNHYGVYYHRFKYPVDRVKGTFPLIPEGLESAHKYGEFIVQILSSKAIWQRLQNQYDYRKEER